MKTKIFGHRGASAYTPENTMSAFRKAAEQHAEGIEIDMHLTKDGVAVISHDDTLERVSNGQGHLQDYTLKELRELDFSHGRGGFSEVRIATLEECYLFCRKAGLTVNTEIKYSPKTPWEELNKTALGIAQKTDMENGILYSSFCHDHMASLKALSDGKARVGLLYDNDIDTPWEYAAGFQADALHPYFSKVDAEMVEQCRRNGIMVNPWTVNEEQDIRRMLDCGVDIIITNFPDRAIRLRDARR